MKQTYWDSEKDMTIKKMVTADLVKNFFPDCKGENVGIMTSLSMTDLEEMIRQGKIDGTSFIYNVDDLSSIENDDLFRTRRQIFEEEWHRRTAEIFGSASLAVPKHRLLYGNIFKMALNVELKARNHFKLLYADSCNTLTDSIVDWLNCGATLEAVDDNGTLIFNITLNHKSCVPDAEDLSGLSYADINSDLFEFCAYKYDGLANVLHYAKKMSMIRRLVEERGNWEVKKMKHYCEKNRNSQMIVVVCKKTKKTK